LRGSWGVWIGWWGAGQPADWASGFLLSARAPFVGPTRAVAGFALPCPLEQQGCERQSHYSPPRCFRVSGPLRAVLRSCCPACARVGRWQRVTLAGAPHGCCRGGLQDQDSGALDRHQEIRSELAGMEGKQHWLRGHDTTSAPLAPSASATTLPCLTRCACRSRMARRPRGGLALGGDVGRRASCCATRMHPSHPAPACSSTPLVSGSSRAVAVSGRWWPWLAPDECSDAPKVAWPVPHHQVALHGHSYAEAGRARSMVAPAVSYGTTHLLVGSGMVPPSTQVLRWYQLLHHATNPTLVAR